MKKDIKYILKRIIIGVGIALILGFLGKYNVFAEEPNNLYLNYFGWNLKEITTTPWGNEPNIVYNFDYSNYNFNINNVSSNFYYLLFKDNENYYIISSNNFNCNSSNLDNYSGNITFTSSNITYNNNDISCSSDSPSFFELRTLSISSLSSSITNEIINNLDSYSYYNEYYNNDIYYNIFLGNYTKDSTSGAGSLYAYNLLKYFYNNFDLVSTSSNINFYLDDELLIPLDYSEIDISDYQAVYFVPKDYTLVDTELISNIEFIKFPFYYKGNINKGYFNINNNQQIVFESPNSTTGGSESEFTYLDTSFPMHYSESGTTSNDLCAYIIYNTGTSTKIRFNSNDFDYYLVQDLHNYSQQITFIDDNKNQVNKTIQFNKTLQEMWEEGLNNDNDYWLSGFLNGGFTNNISGYFDLLKLPFNFLKSLSRDKCSPISLPIPFVNGNLSLNCLSSVFKNVLGNNFYNIIFYLISGLYAYRITIMNIDSLTDVLNPSDDKIEVIDL